MRTVSITEIRQDATRLIDEARRTHETIMVIQRSRPAAYVVPAADYEATQQELRALRHQVFWQEADEAWAEHERGETSVYDNAEYLIADLGLEETGKRASSPRNGSEVTATRKQQARRPRRTPEAAGAA